MTRRALVISFVALFGWWMSCRENRPDAASPTEQSTVTASPEQRHDFALLQANDVVESARILSLPLEPLEERVIQGMALPTYTELPDLSYDQMLERIAATGATHVSIVVSWNQQTIHHNRIRPDQDKTPSDERLGRLIDAAHRADLGVMMFPILHVERRNKGEWRGKLAPTNPERWKAEYEAYVAHYAALSQKHDVEIYSVGSELSSMESDAEWWLSVIANTRANYTGKLIYSANWDHYETPDFWPELDYVGVSSYFEIARRNDEPIHLATERWQRHRDELVEFAEFVDRPVILTEVGYPSVDSAAVKPWDYTTRTGANPNAQLAAFRSLADAWSSDVTSSTSFAGLFIWHGWGHGGPTDESYPIWGKSSERFIRDWYGGAAPGR